MPFSPLSRHPVVSISIGLVVGLVLYYLVTARDIPHLTQQNDKPTVLDPDNVSFMHHFRGKQRLLVAAHTSRAQLFDTRDGRCITTINLPKKQRHFFTVSDLSGVFGLLSVSVPDKSMSVRVWDIDEGNESVSVPLRIPESDWPDVGDWNLLLLQRHSKAIVQYNCRLTAARLPRDIRLFRCDLKSGVVEAQTTYSMLGYQITPSNAHDLGIMTNWSILRRTVQGHILHEFCGDARCGRIIDLRTLRVGSDLSNERHIVGRYWSPSGKYMAVTYADGHVLVFNPTESTVICELSGHSDYVLAVAFSDDEKLVATAGEDRRAFLWELHNGRQLSALSGHTKGVNCIRFIHGDRVVTAGEDCHVIIWDLEGKILQEVNAGRPVREIALEHDNSLRTYCKNGIEQRFEWRNDNLLLHSQRIPAQVLEQYFKCVDTTD